MVTIPVQRSMYTRVNYHLGLDVNIKSVQDLESSSICVGSFIICESPN